MKIIPSFPPLCYSVYALLAVSVLILPPPAAGDELPAPAPVAAALAPSVAVDEPDEDAEDEDSAKKSEIVEADASMQFMDDDSLAAYFWRRYVRSDRLLRSVMSQYDMNVASDQSEVSVEWTIAAMVAELRLLNEDEPDFVAALDASQRAWQTMRDAWYNDLIEQVRSGEMDCGSSTPMVCHRMGMKMLFVRLGELLPLYRGGAGASEALLGLSNPRDNNELARRKKELAAAGRWPLKPADIGADTAYGDGYLNQMEESLNAQDEESESPEASVGSKGARSPDYTESAEGAEGPKLEYLDQ